MHAIEKKVNEIKELSFIENQITQDGAEFVYNWLKKHRMKDVPHNLNMINCDLSLNKVMHNALVEVENELAINRKFQQDVRNIAIERERRKMKASSSEFRRNKKQQLR